MATSLLSHSMIELKCSVCLTFFQWVVSHQVHLVDLFCCPVLEPDMRQGNKELINVQHSIVLPWSDSGSSELLIWKISPHHLYPVVLSHSKERPEFASMPHRTPKTPFNHAASNVRTHYIDHIVVKDQVRQKNHVFAEKSYWNSL